MSNKAPLAVGNYGLILLDKEIDDNGRCKMTFSLYATFHALDTTIEIRKDLDPFPDFIEVDDLFGIKTNTYITCEIERHIANIPRYKYLFEIHAEEANRPLYESEDKTLILTYRKTQTDYDNHGCAWGETTKMELLYYGQLVYAEYGTYMDGIRVYGSDRNAILGCNIAISEIKQMSNSTLGEYLKSNFDKSDKFKQYRMDRKQQIIDDIKTNVFAINTDYD